MLYLCATPIGNLDDVSLRLLNTLQTVDLIAAEDTRHTQKLLNKFNIKTPSTSYHEHNKYEKAPQLVKQMAESEDEFHIALVTDAGMPAISDPGAYLVKKCIEHKIDVTVVPGPVALTTALAISGLPTDRFIFDGFLPRDNKKRKEILSSYENETRTIVLYESPHHIIKTLKDLEALYPTRKMAVLKELTKIHETKIRGSIPAIREYFEELDSIKGEYVLVLEGRDREEIIEEEQLKWEQLSVKSHIELYMNDGYSEKEAMKKAASDRGITNKEIYRIYKINKER